jgi:hypothetical protein
MPGFPLPRPAVAHFDDRLLQNQANPSGITGLDAMLEIATALSEIPTQSEGVDIPDDTTR